MLTFSWVGKCLGEFMEENFLWVSKFNDNVFLMYKFSEIWGVLWGLFIWFYASPVELPVSPWLQMAYWGWWSIALTKLFLYSLYQWDSFEMESRNSLSLKEPWRSCSSNFSAMDRKMLWFDYLTIYLVLFWHCFNIVFS